MIFTFVADGERTWLDSYFDYIATVLMKQIYFRNNSENIAYFIRNILQQLFGICDTDIFAVVVLSDEKSSALRVGKTADPFDVFIAPRLFVLDIL